MRETSVGLGILQIAMTLILVAFLLIVAMWAAIALLMVWLIAQLIAVLLAFSDAREHAAAARKPTGNPALRMRSTDLPLAGGAQMLAAVAAVTTALVFLFRDATWPVVLFAAAAAVIALFHARQRETLNQVAMRVTAVLAVAVVVFGGYPLVVYPPTPIRVEMSGEPGTAINIEEVWEKVGCDPGTTDPNADPGLLLHYKSAAITRVGSCTIDGDDGNFFFEASSADALASWLESGDLTITGRSSNYGDIYRDGAVALFISDADRSVEKAGYRHLLIND